MKNKQIRKNERWVKIELPFKMDRLKVIMRLKGITPSELSNSLHPWATYQSRQIFDWIEGRCAPPKTKRWWERIEKIAKYLEVPIGFFFYNKIEVEMKDWIVKVEIVETWEVFSFSFLDK